MKKTLSIRNGSQLVGTCGNCNEEGIDLAAVSLQDGFMCVQCADKEAGDKPLYHADGTPTAFGEVFIKRTLTTTKEA